MRAEPDWALVRCEHAAQLPALRWKLANLEAFRQRRPADFAAHAMALDAGLGLPVRSDVGLDARG